MVEFSNGVKIDTELTDHRKAMREFDYQARANRPIIYIVTHEETRVIDAMRAICARNDHDKWELYAWDIADGLKSLAHETPLPPTAGKYDQTEVLGWFAEQSPTEKESIQILVLKDFYKFMGADGNAGQVEHTVIRELRNQAQINKQKRKVIVLIGPTLYLPTDLEKMCTVIDWPLPERFHISEKIKEVLNWANDYPQLKEKFQLSYTKAELDDIISSFQGLTLEEIELLCSYMVLTTNKLDATFISTKKQDAIRKSGLLDWIPSQDSMDSIGGLDRFKDWLKKRKNAFSEEAKEYGLPENPKGVLLVGIQGAGKSLSCQAVSKFWNLPLLRLDMGKVFSGIVGSSEENIRSVTKVAESIAPCLLWIDEIDKGLSGTRSSNNTDGGTAARVFGSLLNWMQEKKKPVYIVATANDVSQLPPELLRKGRFDEIFFVDLPNQDERCEIFNIHLKKRGRNPDDYDMNKLVEISENFTGAEIEAAVIAAMYESFDDGKRAVTTQDIAEAMGEMVPLATTMSEQVDALRDWANTRARNASNPQSECKKKSYNKVVEKKIAPKVVEKISSKVVNTEVITEKKVENKVEDEDL